MGTATSKCSGMASQLCQASEARLTHTVASLFKNALKSSFLGEKKATTPDALTSYIIRSWVKGGSNLLLKQPYSPHLFRRGNQPGPHLLNEILQRRMTTEEARLALPIQKRRATPMRRARKTLAASSTLSPLHG